MSLVVIDSETFKLDPKNPKTVMVDEVGVVCYQGNEVELKIEEIYGELLELYIAGIAERPGEVEEVATAQVTAVMFGNGQRVKISGLSSFVKKLPIIEQLLDGREVSKKTLDWHTSRGYNPELEKREITVKEAMAWILKACHGNMVFCRGQDFDFPLLNSFLPGDETICHFRSARDIRTAFDELLMDGKYDLIKDERVLASPLFTSPLIEEATREKAVLVLELASRVRRELGHRALYDAKTDMCLLLLFRLLRRKLVDGMVE